MNKHKSSPENGTTWEAWAIKAMDIRRANTAQIAQYNAGDLTQELWNIFMAGSTMPEPPPKPPEPEPEVTAEDLKDVET